MVLIPNDINSYEIASLRDQLGIVTGKLLTWKNNLIKTKVLNLKAVILSGKLYQIHQNAVGNREMNST